MRDHVEAAKTEESITENIMDVPARLILWERRNVNCVKIMLQ